MARELGKDPAEVRRLNFIKPEQFPYKSAAGAVYDTGNYEGALDKALEMADYKSLRAEQVQKRAEGKLMGIGISSYIEICGFVLREPRLSASTRARACVSSRVAP